MYHLMKTSLNRRGSNRDGNPKLVGGRINLDPVVTGLLWENVPDVGCSGHRLKNCKLRQNLVNGLGHSHGEAYTGRETPLPTLLKTTWAALWTMPGITPSPFTILAGNALQQHTLRPLLQHAQFRQQCTWW